MNNAEGYHDICKEQVFLFDSKLIYILWLFTSSSFPLNCSLYISIYLFTQDGVLYTLGVQDIFIE